MYTSSVRRADIIWEGDGVGGSGEDERVCVPGCLDKMRKTVEVWVSHGVQEERAGRGRSSSDPFGQNSWEDGQVMFWVRHNQYASPLAAQECGFTETMFWSYLALVFFYLTSSVWPQQPTTDRFRRSRKQSETIRLSLGTRGGRDAWKHAALICWAHRSLCVWVHRTHCLGWNTAGSTPGEHSSRWKEFLHQASLVTYIPTSQTLRCI